MIETDPWGTWPETRAENLRDLDAAHVSAAEAIVRLGTNEEQLQQWCRRHGMADLFNRMHARNPAVLEDAR